jgi:SAM-dependent methyltransferase
MVLREKHGLDRQVSTTLDGIRPDHLARYRWARDQLPKDKPLHVVDAPCGIGYGSWIMAQHQRLVGVDIDQETIDFARQFYSHPNVNYMVGDMTKETDLYAEAVVCFEGLEHVLFPQRAARNFLLWGAEILLCSVPNEDVIPFDPDKHIEHMRHYTPDQFEELLHTAGWEIIATYGQKDKRSEVTPSFHGMTLVARCIPR